EWNMQMMQAWAIQEMVVHLTVVKVDSWMVGSMLGF
ncbi:uncharacterized protein METZ01_LOCUS91556, partial [marine metagenome]